MGTPPSATLVRAVATWVVLVLLPAAHAAAQGFDLPGVPGTGVGPGRNQAAEHFRIHAVASHNQVTPGQTFHVALVGQLDEGWVYYSPDPGPVVLAGSLAVQAGPIRTARTLWLKDQAKTVDYGEGPKVNHVYKHAVTVYAELTAPKDAPAGPVEVRLTPRGQICLSVCINLEGPNELSAATKVAIAPQAEANPAWSADLADGLKAAMTPAELKAWHAAEAAKPLWAPKGAAATRPAATTPAATASATAPAAAVAPLGAQSGLATQAGQYSLWAGLGLALLAGLTLNIMPCILPIIPLRILTLVQMAGQSRRRFVTLGLAFAGGIVLFFVGIAAVNVILKSAGGASLNVNVLFRYAALRIAMAMVLLALAANLFGLFNVTVPSRIAAAGPQAGSQGHLPAVGMGFMMAVLSTPCSFWLMALSLAWAELQPLWLGTATIVLIGVGMAVPHVLLASFPGLVDRLPRPGRWMELFKQTMGFLLLPAVLYLLSTLSPAGGYPLLVAGFGVVLVMGLWIWGSWVRYDAPLGRKLLLRGLAAAMVLAAGLWLLPPPADKLLRIEPLDPARIAQARAEGRVVMVRVTAEWCTECKILEHQVFNTAPVADELRRRNVLVIVADVTDASSRTSHWVQVNFGGAPPLTILYPPGTRPPTVIPGRFSQDELIEMLQKAQGR
jgi:thiol:disulfide interchange protein DsbD